MSASCESCNAKELAGAPVVQPKLVVGPVNDPYEQEADRVADHVMRMPDTEVATTSEKAPGPVIQRMCTDCEEEEKVQRQVEDEEEQSVQAKRESGPTGGEVSAQKTAEIESIKTGGEPLRPATRNFFEPRFGHDFSSVRIHSDDRAAQSAKGIHAHAYTTGQHIVFGAGRYSPDTDAGQKLLAHELTHVIQQSSGAQIRRKEVSQSEQENKSGPVAVADRELLPGPSIEGPLASPAGNEGPTPPPDEPSVSRMPGSDSGNKGRLQRKATFVKTTPDPVINPAEQIAENKIPDAELYFGRTNFLLNGTSFTKATDAAMNQALKKPNIAYNNTTMTVGTNQGSGSGSGSGSGAQPKTIPAVECWFDSVPDNEGSNEVKVLTSGSWSHVTEKKNVFGRFPTLKACNKGAGDVTFVVKGDPNAKTVGDKVKAHEKQHADDNEALFKDLVIPWDTAITTAFKSKTKAKVPTKNICDKAVYLLSGKDYSPADLVANLSKQIDKKGKDFHGEPAGARPTTKPEQPDSDCNVVKARTGY